MLKQRMDPQSFDEQMERLLVGSKARTQAELAAILGITQPSISEAKRRRTIPAEWLVSLLHIMHVNPEWVMSGRGEMYLNISGLVTSEGAGQKAVPG